MSLGELKMISISDFHQMDFVIICKSSKANLIIDKWWSLVKAEDISFLADFLEQSSLRWVVNSILFKRNKHHIIKRSESLSVNGVLWMKFLIVELGQEVAYEVCVVILVVFGFVNIGGNFRVSKISGWRIEILQKWYNIRHLMNRVEPEAAEWWCA